MTRAAGLPTLKNRGVVEPENAKAPDSGDAPAGEPKPAELGADPKAPYTPRDWLKDHNRERQRRQAAKAERFTRSQTNQQIEKEKM